MLCTIYLAHWLLFLCYLPLFDVLRSFKPVKEIVSEAFVEIDDQTRHDFVQQGIRAPKIEEACQSVISVVADYLSSRSLRCLLVSPFLVPILFVLFDDLLYIWLSR
jgi:hypothetical protein